MNEESPLLQMRRLYAPKIPAALGDLLRLTAVPLAGDPEHGAGLAPPKPDAGAASLTAWIKNAFAPLGHLAPVSFERQGTAAARRPKLRVGVVLSGGQAPGGHNVICGLLQGLGQIADECELLGFLGGPGGILQSSYRRITRDDHDQFLNTGGFDMIGSGRTKIETPEQFAACEKLFRELGLDGLVIIGGDDSNTNAALLANHLRQSGCQTTVVGVPKTIDGDLRSRDIEISFGFDSAAKLYSELISNIAVDARSARKYYHFVRLMGRSASHITLESALRTRPNLALISEEIRAEGKSLLAVARDIADCVMERARAGKHFGVVLVPEGVIEFIPEMTPLIRTLSDVLAKLPENATFETRRKAAMGRLTEELGKTFAMIPKEIQKQLLFDRDPHGNVQVSKIETEKLLAGMVKKLLQEEAAAGRYPAKEAAKFATIEHFFGYEGRCLAPTNFDADYTFSLGLTAASLVFQRLSGYIAGLSGLTGSPAAWRPLGIPLPALMTIEKRHGAEKLVIEKALVRLDGGAFREFAAQRDAWRLSDNYRFQGPVQYFGPPELCDEPPLTLLAESGARPTGTPLAAPAAKRPPAHESRV